MINPSLLADLEDQLDEINEEQEQYMQDENQVKKEDEQKQISSNDMQSKLLTKHREAFLSHMNKISTAIDQTIEKVQKKQADIRESMNKQETINNINKSNEYALQIFREIQSIAKFVKKIYNKKFPQLQSLITNEGLYCKAVLQIQDQTLQIGKEKFQYLNQHQKIALKISLSSPRDPLLNQQTKKIRDAARIAVQLQDYYETLMVYLESYMNVIAPNLCQLTGSLVASKLIATTGGVDKLAATPACNIQVLGGSRSAQFGFSQMQRNHTGLFGMMDVVKDAPKKFQMKLVRMLATNTAKCARADSLGTSQNLGTRLREEMYERFQKVQQQGGLMREQKPLEVPDQAPKKKRGGKRHRKTKQLYEMTEARKQQNRVKFGQEAQQQIDEGVGLGMLKQAGMGKLKVHIKKQRIKNSKKMQQRANKKSGLQSSLNLNATQGIQLINPARQQNQKGTESYFRRQAGFRTVLNNKMK